MRLVEVLPPAGALCGSSHLNRRLKEHLLQRLEGVREMSRDGATKESLIDLYLVEFENNLKRTFDISRLRGPTSIFLPGLGLHDDPVRGFQKGTLVLS